MKSEKIVYYNNSLLINTVQKANMLTARVSNIIYHIKRWENVTNKDLSLKQSFVSVLIWKKIRKRFYSITEDDQILVARVRRQLLLGSTARCPRPRSGGRGRGEGAAAVGRSGGPVAQADSRAGDLSVGREICRSGGRQAVVRSVRSEAHKTK